MQTLPRVLIVDDQPHNLDVLISYLADARLQLAVATRGEEAVDLAAHLRPDLILLDVMMPGIDGFETCRRIRALPDGSRPAVIFMSALSDPDSRVQGFAAGAIDYLSKPLHREEVLARIQAQLTIRQQQQLLEERNHQLQELNTALQAQIDQREAAEAELVKTGATLSTLTRQEAERWGLDAFVGQSLPIRQLLEQLRSLQHAPDTSVLVLGESGTGKELVSRAIHFGSQRAGKPFIAVNCAAIPSELADAEFFGHSKGAFTGATHERAGLFEQADGGTLFLDEIGDMPLPLQTRLLRVLEDGQVTPLGSNRSRHVNVRVVAATHADLQEQVLQKQFRQDLYFRLAGYRLHLPPLRQRRDDIPLLVQHFIQQLGRQMGRRDQVGIHPRALAALCQYDFPGNVRELRNIMEFALIASRHGEIDLPHLHFMHTVSGYENSAPAASALSAVNRLPFSEYPNEINPADAEQALDSEEQRLLQCAAAEGRIDNTRARLLLGVDHDRASYLLKKLHREGRLQKQGDRRWSYYQLPG